VHALSPCPIVRKFSGDTKHQPGAVVCSLWLRVVSEDDELTSTKSDAATAAVLRDNELF
jgi:hypothetical protein